MSTTSQDAGPGMAAAQEVASTAADQAGQVSRQAADHTKQVAGAAAKQAWQVGQDATVQARTLIGQAKDQSRQQAESQTQQIAAVLARVGDQARALLAGNREAAGSLPEYAENVISKLDQVSGRVQDGGFDGLVTDVQRFARRRPGVFLMGAAALGFGLGRLLRSGAAQQATASQRSQTAPEVLPSGPTLIPTSTDAAEDVLPPVTPPPAPVAQPTVGPGGTDR